MATSINGTNGIIYPDNSTQASAQVGMKNRIIDGGFIINQRVYVSNTALSSGVYAHDRWKAGASGCTYTFTQGSLGVNITITITAGSLQQVIEGCNMPEGGTYTVSWTGTAQCRVNGGSYGTSPVTVTGLTAGSNCTVEFNTGTVNSVQLEKGSTATSFDYRPYGTELALCQRYYFKWLNSTGSATYALNLQAYSSSAAFGKLIDLPVTMRSTPTCTTSGSFTAINATGGSTTAFSATTIGAPTNQSLSTGAWTGASGLVAGNIVTMFVPNNAYIDASAEL